MDFKRNEDVLRCRPAIIKLIIDSSFILVPLALFQVGLLFVARKLTLEDSYALQVFNWLYRLFCCLVGLEMVRRYFDQQLIMGHTRVLQLKGIVAWRAVKVSLRYADVREIHVTQTICGRIFGYGDISVGTAASGEYEIVLIGFANPQRIAHLLDELRKGSDSSSRAGGNTLLDGEPEGDLPKVIVPPFRSDAAKDKAPTHSID